MRCRLLMLLVVLASTVLSAAPSSAAEKRSDHCVIRVVGQRSDGEFVTTSPQCFATFAEAMAATGIPAARKLPAGATSADVKAANATVTTTSIIGIHYDGFGWSGSSMTVQGSDCTGGWINTSSSWSNRIRSTSNGCARIRHWDLANKGGDWEETYNVGGNLSSLDQRTNSIQYLS